MMKWQTNTSHWLHTACARGALDSNEAAKQGRWSPLRLRLSLRCWSLFLGYNNEK